MVDVGDYGRETHTQTHTTEADKQAHVFTQKH